MNDQIKSILRTVIIAAILLIVVTKLPEFWGLWRTGFDSSAVIQQFFFYSEAAWYSLGIILLLTFATIIIFYATKQDRKYGFGLGFADQGEPPAAPMFKRFSTFQLAFLSCIVFYILGMFVFFTTQTYFSDVITLKEQFTPFDSLVFSAFLVPISENLGAAAVLAAGIFGLRLWFRKKDGESANFVGFCYMLVILVGLYGLGNHFLRYGGQDTSLLVVLIFWSLGALVTLVTGSFFPFMFMHLFNNMFGDLRSLFLDNDTIKIWVIAIAVVLILAYILIFRKHLFGKAKVEEIQY